MKNMEVEMERSTRVSYLRLVGGIYGVSLVTFHQAEELCRHNARKEELLDFVCTLYGASMGDVNKAARLLGKKGGEARAKKLTPKERSEIARKAGKAGGRGRGKDKK